MAVSGEAILSAENGGKPLGGRGRFVPNPTGGAHSAPPDPLAGGEGVDAQLQESPLSAFDSSVLSQWTILAGTPLCWRLGTWRWWWIWWWWRLPWQRDSAAGCNAACALLIEAKADVAATDRDGLTGKLSFRTARGLQPNCQPAPLHSRRYYHLRHEGCLLPLSGCLRAG